MPFCKNNPKKSYKGTEPSPKGLGYCASSEKIGEKKKGKDGNMWQVKKISNGKRWIKLNKIDCSKFVKYQKKEKGIFLTNINKIEGLRATKGYIYKYIDFNNFENKETKIPNGYKKVNIKKNIIKKYYCDSSRKLLNKNNEEYKKIKSKTKGYKSYFTHDNGGRPFLVYVSKKDVQIYKEDKKFYSTWSDWNTNDNNNKWIYIKLIKEYKPLEIFIGKSPLNNMTKFSGGHGKQFDGNSVLLKISKDRYVFIGNTIYEFSTDNDKILKYYSPVGNNDVPYPFAYGEKNVYFMLNNKYIPYDNIKELENKKETDGYNYYYGDKEKYAKKMKKVKYIHRML